MSRGYQLERETELWMIAHADQHKDMPLYKRSHRISNSGGMRGDKGDVLSVNVPWFSKQVMFECKRRAGKRVKDRVFSAEEAWIIKNEKEAKQFDCVPVMLFAFTGAAKARKWAMYRDEDWGFILPTTGWLEINKKRRILLRHSVLLAHEKNPLKSRFSTVIFNGTEPVLWHMISWELFTSFLDRMKEQWHLKTSETQ